MAAKANWHWNYVTVTLCLYCSLLLVSGRGVVSSYHRRVIGANTPWDPWEASPPTLEIMGTIHGTGSLGHRVSGSFRSSFTSGSPGHHFDPAWDPSFSGFRKNAQNAKRTFEMLKWQKSLSGVCCWTEINGCQSMQWTFTFTYDY